jgi:hypothetical protein
MALDNRIVDGLERNFKLGAYINVIAALSRQLLEEN